MRLLQPNYLALLISFLRVTFVGTATAADRVAGKSLWRAVDQIERLLLIPTQSRAVLLSRLVGGEHDDIRSVAGARTTGI